MKKALLSKLVGELRAKVGGAPVHFWQPADKPYPNIAALDPAAEDLFEKSGIYALWHLGVRPQWLRVGVSANLGTTLTALAKESWVIAHGKNRGVYAAWAWAPPEQGMGVVRFLIDKLQPAFQDGAYPDERAVEPAVAPVTCVLPPGTRE